MADFRLVCFSYPGLECDGQPVKLETRKALALLVYLRMAGHDVSRESLAALLWPEYDQHHALANLRRTLASLNKSLQINLIQADRERIGLREPLHIWLDVEAFVAYLTHCEHHPHPQGETCLECQLALESAIQLYQGDFLEGFNLSGSPDFDDWQHLHRESLRQQYGLALQKLSEIFASQENWQSAISFARRQVSLDRLDEDASRLLMHLYVRSGQRGLALHHFEELASLLKEDLGLEPEPETIQLFEQIREQPESKIRLESPERRPSFPLLKTKLYIPSPPASYVKRSHLTERLDEVEWKTLTLISAPAGFGKTTLLAEWIAHTSLPVAWLSLDNGDNDPYRLLAYLMAALENIQENIGLEACQLMQSIQPAPPNIVLASLINDLNQIATPHVMALDDYQFITEPAVHEILAYLIDHHPVNLHLVIATRADPPLPIGRLRAHGQLLEMRAQDLRFNFQEQTQFLNQVMKLGLSQQNLQALEIKTEGWIVGLQMAALSLRNREDRDRFIQAFSGSNRFVMDYLLEEVLASQPAYIGNFFYVTSHLERLSGPLCDAVMGQEWSLSQHPIGQEILEYLEQVNLFVIPLDDDRLWYRYHHLFADLLRTRASRFSAEEIITIYHQASLWCEEHGFTSEAIRYAINAGEYSRAAELIDKLNLFLFLPTDFGELQSYINEIPIDIIRQHPWACLIQTHIWVTLGFLDKVEEWLSWAENAAQMKQLSGSDYQEDDITITIALHRAYLTLFKRDLSNAAGLATIAYEKLKPSQVILRCRLALLLGESYILQGNFDKSRSYFLEAIDLGKSIPDMFLVTTAIFRLSLQLKIQGKLNEAESIYHENLQLLRSSKLDNSPLMAKPEIGLGDIYRERNQLSLAENYLVSGLRRAESLGHIYDLTYAYNLMAKFMQASGNFDQALEYINKSAALFETYSIPEAIGQVVKHIRATLWIIIGRVDLAEDWINSRVIDLTSEISFLNEMDFTTQARCMLARHNYSDAIQLLTRLAETAKQAGRIERLIKALVLLAIAYQETGDGEKALPILIESLILAEPEGYKRIFLDEGKSLIKLLVEVRKSKSAPQLNSYINQLLETYNPKINLG